MTDDQTQTNHDHESLRERATHAYESAVARAGDTVEHSRDTAGSAIENNPLGVLAGGLALGALVGALVPRSEREKTILAPVGKRVNAAAAAAVVAAKEAGRNELHERGLSKEAAREQVKSLFQGVTKAAAQAGTAAAQAGKEQMTATAQPQEQ